MLVVTLIPVGDPSDMSPKNSPLRVIVNAEGGGDEDPAVTCKTKRCEDRAVTLVVVFDRNVATLAEPAAVMADGPEVTKKPVG